jgi:hypothetical protein
MFKKLFGNAGVLKDLFSFLWKARLYWMIPMIVTIVILGLLILFAQSSPIAPFVYTLF